MSIQCYNLGKFHDKNTRINGLMICYLLSVNDNIKFMSLDIESKYEEIDLPLKWNYTYNKEEFNKFFHSLEMFVQAFDSDDFGRWTLKFCYRGINFSASLEDCITEIALSCLEENKKINILPLINEIQAVAFKEMGNRL